MGFTMSTEEFDIKLSELQNEHKIYAPVLWKARGTCSDTDIAGYGPIHKIEDIVFDRKSDYSPKEVLVPITQTVFYFTEDKIIEPEDDEKKQAYRNRLHF